MSVLPAEEDMEKEVSPRIAGVPTLAGATFLSTLSSLIPLPEVGAKFSEELNIVASTDGSSNPEQADGLTTTYTEFTTVWKENGVEESTSEATLGGENRSTPTPGLAYS